MGRLRPAIARRRDGDEEGGARSRSRRAAAHRRRSLRGLHRLPQVLCPWGKIALDQLSRFAVWLSQTTWSTELHESLYAYTWIETAHVIGITLFVGTIAMVDLRLLGWAWRTVPISQMTARILP